MGIDGKNCKSRILEAASIVKGSLLMAPVQSTSKEVLKNIKRQGISIDQMVEIVKESEKIGSSSFSEVILCLPGDTKNTHFNSILDLINSEIDIVRSHQLIMLPGSEAATRKNREEYGLITRFRVTPGTSESYNLFEETFAAPEIDEICVASNSMSFNDYLECRLFNLTVEIFYNYNIFQGLLKFLKIYKINLASFILAVHEQIKKSEHLSKLYDNFLTETKEVWETREKLSGFLKQPGVIERYQSKELGNNEQLLYRALATLNHMDSIHEITANVAKDLLIKEGYSNEQILNYLKELTEFSLSRKKDLLAIENTSEKTFHYDFINLLANNFNDNPLTYYKPEGIAVSFSYSNEQKEFISKHLEIYGQSKNGLSFILSAIFRSTNPYRRAQLLNPPEKEEVNKNSKNIDKIEETENYLKTMASKFEVSQIQELLDRLNPLSVLVIGDTILDHYVFVKPKGRAIKDPILSVEYKNREIYAGGILAIANHLSDFVSKIKLVTLVGDHDSYQDTIIQSLRKNIELKSFIKVNSPTTMKKRMIDNYRNNKLFKIEYINDRPINLQLTQEVLDFLEEEVPKHDLVIVGDFGHGFINDVIRRKLEEKSKFLAVNAQSNSANMGFNYINLYRQQDFISMDEQEIRLPLSMRFEEIDAVLKAAHQKFQYPNFMVTQGKKGCLFVNQGNTYSSPGIITSVKDTVGAGDALFAISSLVVYLQAHPELVPFIGNCAGGIAANIMGNKEPVTKEKILSFINEVYQNEMGRIQKSD